MRSRKAKSLILTAGMWAMTAGMITQPFVYAENETALVQDASEEDIPEAEVENGPTDDEVTNENARTPGTEAADENTNTSDTDSEGETVELGNAEDEEGSQGQTGATIYSVGDMDRTNAVAVTFNLDVPEDMVYPCIVTFTESESYTEYYIEAYKTAGYSTTAYLEPGTYLITDGYPTNDNVSAYTVVDKSYFTVSEGENMTVNVTIRSKGDILRGDRGNASDEQTSAEDTAVTNSTQTEEKDNRILYIIAAAVFMSLGIAIGVFGIKYFEKSEE